MGSFASTCCISGMPIEWGDDVRYFLLTENPYDDSLICSPHDMWFPRTFPLKAKYNDYGSIEGYDPDGPGVYAVVEGLRKDMVPVGVGDNCVHDVATQKGMSFEDTLTAIWERRVHVQREYDTFDEKRKERNITLGKIRELLEKYGEDIGDLEFPKEMVETQEEKVAKSRPWQPTLQRVVKLLKDNDFEVNPGWKDATSEDGYLVNEQGQG